jgi:DnaJ-domain-containing protein 1
MEAREEVDETDDQEQLIRILKANKEREAALVERLSQAFKKGDLDAAVDLTTRLTYWVRLEQSIQQKL